MEQKKLKQYTMSGHVEKTQLDNIRLWLLNWGPKDRH